MFDHCLGILREDSPYAYPSSNGSVHHPWCLWGNKLCFGVWEKPFFQEPSLPWEKKCCNIIRITSSWDMVLLCYILLTSSRSNEMDKKKCCFTFRNSTLDSCHGPHLEDAHLFSTSLLTTLACVGPLSSSLTNFPNWMVELSKNTSTKKVFTPSWTTTWVKVINLN